MIETLLKQLGFNEKEIVVYLAIQKAGKISPVAIAKQTSLNRTTVYSIAKLLVSRGVIREDLGTATRYLVALPPQDLNQIAVKEKRELKQKEAVIGKAIEELQTLQHGTTYEIPKIVFIPEDDINDYLYKQTDAWNESTRQYDGTIWGFQDTSLVKHYEEWIDWYWQGETRKDMQLKLLSNESAEAIKKTKYTNRQIKFWKQSKDFTATTWIAGDYVLMLVTSDSPRHLVEIHDAVLAHNLREVFKGIWSTLA